MLDTSGERRYVVRIAGFNDSVAFGLTDLTDAVSDEVTIRYRPGQPGLLAAGVALTAAGGAGLIAGFGTAVASLVLFVTGAFRTTFGTPGIVVFAGISAGSGALLLIPGLLSLFSALSKLEVTPGPPRVSR